MIWAIGALAAVLYVVGRDAAHLSWRSALTLLGALSWPVLAAAALDAGVGRARPGWLRPHVWLRVSTGLVTLVPLAFGLFRWWIARAALPPWSPVALVIAAALGAVALDRAGSAGVDHPDHAGPGRLWAACVLVAGFLAVHRATGTLTAVREGTGKLHVALFAGTLLASCALLVPLGARAGLHRRDEPTRLGPRLAALTLAVALALLEVDRRALAGLYAPVHVWLGASGLLCLDVAVASFAARLRRPASTIGGALSLAALAALAASAALGVPSRVTDPVTRADISATPSGAWVLEVLASSPRDHARVRPPEHPALVFDHHLGDAPPARPDHLLLVTLDALRADRIGTAEAPQPAAPNLDRFARQAVRFRRAYTQGTRTVIATGALMAGRYAADMDWRLKPFAGRFAIVPAIPRGGALAERLRHAGYRTMAAPFVGTNEFFRKGFGFDRGFDSFADLSHKGWKPPSSDYVVDAALKQIEDAGDARWFQWVHLFDTHESERSLDRYESLLRAEDAALGRLLDALDARGLSDRTVVVVMADHGESFGEHGVVSHGTALYEEQARIPLLVRMPGAAPRDEARPVAAIDVTATLACLAGARTEGLEGVNLLPLIDHGIYPEGRPLFVESFRNEPGGAELYVDIKAVVLGDLKLVVDRRRDTSALFDVSRDPGEADNLAATRPADVARLSAILGSFVGRAEADHPPP